LSYGMFVFNAKRTTTGVMIRKAVEDLDLWSFRFGRSALGMDSTCLILVILLDFVVVTTACNLSSVDEITSGDEPFPRTTLYLKTENIDFEKLP
jgi:hypothetical protein